MHKILKAQKLSKWEWGIKVEYSNFPVTRPILVVPPSLVSLQGRIFYSVDANEASDVLAINNRNDTNCQPIKFQTIFC